VVNNLFKKKEQNKIVLKTIGKLLSHRKHRHNRILNHLDMFH